MANVRPFRGLLFNPEIIGDMAQVVCPPYDVISNELQLDLYDRSPFNIVRIEDGKILSSDDSRTNRYTRAADTLKQWINKKVLLQDETPAYYLVQHRFVFNGLTKSRTGLIGNVELEQYKNGVVLPHEYTQTAPKTDRLALMESCNSNISQIMLLYRDKDKVLEPLFQQVRAEKPVFDFSDRENNVFTMWRIDDPNRVHTIAKFMSLQKLYIADGHHRYETALTYRDKATVSDHLNTQGSRDFLMSYLVEFEDPGLVVLPYHRVVGGLNATKLSQILEKIKHMFTESHGIPLTELPLDSFLKKIEVQGETKNVMGFIRARDNQANIITLHPELGLKKYGPMASFEAWILEEMVLKPVMGDSIDEHVTWVHDAEEAVNHLLSGNHQLGFLLKALPMDLFESVVSRGDRLPRKSTFFHPKLPTGLAMNILNHDPHRTC